MTRWDEQTKRNVIIHFAHGFAPEKPKSAQAEMTFESETA